MQLNYINLMLRFSSGVTKLDRTIGGTEVVVLYILLQCWKVYKNNSGEVFLSHVHHSLSWCVPCVQFLAPPVNPEDVRDRERRINPAVMEIKTRIYPFNASIVTASQL